MAAVKWYNEFADIDGAISGVEILDRDYSGEKTRVKGGDVPFVLDMPNMNDPFTAIRATKGEIRWTSQDNVNFGISELFITDDRKYTVRFYRYNEDETTKEYLWYGYLTFADCEEPYASKPYYVTASATCGLPFLREDYFLDAFGSFINGELSLIKIIANCLSSAGHELDIHTYVNLFEEGMPYGVTSALALAKIDADGLRGMKADEVLKGVLSTLGAFVVQSSGVWVIKSIREQASYQNIVRKFNSNGDSIGVETVVQAASFGRGVYNSSTPNVRPKSGVIEKLAKPNSIVTETVSPGNPVNKLTNGTFGGPIVGGVIPGWNNNLNPISWSREGSNRPDDPYRLVMNGHVYLDPKKKRYPFNPNAHISQDPFEINVGDFSLADKTNVKLVLSGAFRSKNVMGVPIFIMINEGDRDFSSYLNANGAWKLSKKETDEVDIRSDTGYTDKVADVSEFPLQTFEITSDPITNFLKISNEGVARIKVRIYPGVRFPGQIDPTSAVSFEDFSLVVKTDSPFEGDHKYRVDAKFPIRNPVESEYTSIIADKIDITTPEQKRIVNRVMTGYMTRPNGQLTTGWLRYTNGVIDPSDSVFEPIQKKSLRERVRLLCGKRRVFQGKFHGYGVRPDHSMFSRRENPGAPEKFFTITAWRWDVKFKTYTLTMHELDFTPLAKEDIDIVGSEDGIRGNRMYGGAGGSSTAGGAGSSPEPIEEILLDDIDPLYFTVGEEKTQSFDLGALIESSQLPSELEAKIIYVPDWMLAPYEDRGPDGDLLTFTVTGTPAVVGRDQIVIELIGLEGQDYNAVIPLITEKKMVSDYTLLSTDPDPEILGALPGMYEVPLKSDVRVKVEGANTGISGTLVGGGDSGTDINIPYSFDVEINDSHVYRIFGDTDGLELPVGQYVLTNSINRGEVAVRTEEILFTLYDEAFLAKCKSFLTVGGVDVGEITPDGTTIFTNQAKGNIKAVVDDVEHDKATIETKKDGAIIETKVYDLPASELTGEYFQFDVDEELGKGVYSTTVSLSLATESALKRAYTFEIAEAEPKPEPGLKLVTFKPGTINYTVIDTLPLKGKEYDMPVNYTVLFDGLGGIPYASAEWEFFFLRGGAFAPVNIEQYTGYPQNINYGELVTNEKLLIFGLKNSTQIGDIHVAPSMVRAVVTARDETGKIVGIRQSDFSFRIPLGPEDYSGTVFLKVDNTSSTPITVVDEDVPKIGRKFILGEYPERWSMSTLSYNGEFFNKVATKLRKKISGTYVPLHYLADSVTTIEFGAPIDVLPNYGAVMVIWLENPDHTRYLYGPSPTNEHISIDDLTQYETSFEFYLDDILIGTKVAEFELINEPTEPPIKDCCDCDCEGGGSEQLEFLFNDPAEEWIVTHNLNKKPEPNILVGGRKVISDVQYIDNDIFKIIHSKPYTGVVIINS